MASSIPISFPLLQILLLLSTFQLSSPHPPTPNDTAALTAFRFSVDIHGNLADNWSTPDACSGHWLGVRCSPNGRIIALSLPSLDLRGPLSTLSPLDQLRVLDLSSNRLNGTLPPLLPSLTNLKLLYLSRNDLFGEISSAISRRILRIDLSNNNFVGQIPSEVSNLTRLLTLRIQNNLLSGPLPDLIAKLPNLVEFNASNNQLSGRVPDGILTKFGSAPFAGNARLCGLAPPLPLCSKVLIPSSPSSSSSQSVVPSNPSSMPGSIAAVAVGSEKNAARRSITMWIILGNVFLLLMILSLFLICCCSWHLGVNNNSKVDGGGEDGLSNADPYSIQAEQKKSNSEESEDATASPQTKMVFFEEEQSSGERRRRKRRRFGLEELLRASAEMVGKGSLGTVYRAALEDGRVMAVKRLRDANPFSRSEFRRHMELIGRLSHPNVVPLRAYYFAKQEKLLVYDFLPNGSLRSLLHDHRTSTRRPLDWTTRVEILLGAARGIAGIHSSSSGIPHGNVKSSNVLIDKNGVARVSDFGLAVLVGPKAKPSTYEADVYGFGVVILEVLTGRAPDQLDPRGSGVGLVEWVRSVVREEWKVEVLDGELIKYKDAEEEMVAVLHTGLSCTAQQAGSRPNMAEVVRMIEDIRAETRSPIPESDGDSRSPSLDATTDDGRFSYVTDC